MKNLHDELCKIRKKQQQLKQLIEDSVDTHGVKLDGCLHNNFKQMVKECEVQMEGATPNSFKWVFWQQQMDATSKTEIKGHEMAPTNDKMVHLFTTSISSCLQDFTPIKMYIIAFPKDSS